MTEKPLENEHEKKESAPPRLEGEALLQFYALRGAQQAEDGDHQADCPCCLPR